jgi:hypothetical protein
MIVIFLSRTETKCIKMEKFNESLDKAAYMLRIADHMLYMTYPLVKEKRLLLKILNEIYLIVLNIVNSILQYEYVNKRINLYKNSRENFSTFKDSCAGRYSITGEQIRKILEIFELAEKHKQSPFEFVRNNKVVIVTNAFHTDVITIEKMKDYLFLAKDILGKAEAIVKKGE